MRQTFIENYNQTFQRLPNYVREQSVMHQKPVFGELFSGWTARGIRRDKSADRPHSISYIDRIQI